MTAPLVLNQELVIHLFAPLDGELAPQAHRQLRQVWNACRDRLGMTQPVKGVPSQAWPTGSLVRLSQDGAAAAREGSPDVRQAVLRRVHDVLNVSVGLAPQASDPETPDGSAGRGPAAPQRHVSWTDLAQLWARAGGSATDALLGEARVYLGWLPPGENGAVEATSEFGQALDLLLPHRQDRPRDWWRWGSTTSTGYAVWDTGLAADTATVREIVIIGPADRRDELSGWAWSDGTPGMPPFGRYLMHAAKLRFEARLLDAWHAAVPAGYVAARLAELAAESSAQAPPSDQIGSLRAKASRLEELISQLSGLQVDLESLRKTAQICAGNLTTALGAGVAVGDGAVGMFAADRELADWLVQQATDDLDYLGIELRHAKEEHALAANDQVQRAVPAPPAAGPVTVAQAAVVGAAVVGPAGAAQADAGQVGQTDSSAAAPTDVSRCVFLVSGRDNELTMRFRDLLHVVDLKPLEWEALVAATGTTAPYLGQVVANAPKQAQATLVLISPDDIVELHSEMYLANDQPHELGRSAQARPNVYFELGLALMAYPDRTVVVEVGQIRPVADLAGLNVIRFDGSPYSIKKVLDRLAQAGCPVDFSGTDWLEPDRFARVTAALRGPDSHRGPGSHGDS